MSIQKTVSVLALSLGVLTAQAQDTYTPSRDYFNFSLNYDGLAGETEGIKLKGLNRGFSSHIMFDFPIKTSNFSFAGGVGISSHNYYLNGQRFQMKGQDNVVFENLVTPDIDNYEKSKLSINYVEAPLEFRYFANKNNRNKGFKMSAGVKVGYLLDAHTKEKVNMNGSVITQKFKGSKDLFNQWRFAPMVKVGWGNFSVFAQYNVSQLFAPGVGPEVFPYTIGFSISGL